jgi:hypothetical protein
MKNLSFAYAALSEIEASKGAKINPPKHRQPV